MSPGGTIIRPPPLPQSSTTAVIQDRPIAPEAVSPSYRDPTPYVSSPSDPSPTQADRPEEPAKYISEIPKLPSADISTSAVVCGNWLAQLRQIFVGLSPSANTWWQAVELASNRYYQKWLIADPLDRLSLHIPHSSKSLTWKPKHTTLNQTPGPEIFKRKA